MKRFAQAFAALIDRRLIAGRCCGWLNCLIFKRRAEVLEDMSLQFRSRKSPPKSRHRQLILALDKLPLDGQLPSGVRSKCVTLITELLRSVVFKSNSSKGGCDER